MADKKVRIDEYLLERIKKVRENREKNIEYPSDKHFVQVAIIKLLKKEEKDV